MNKALFLDRDGIVNIDRGYIYKIEDFEFVDGIFNLLKYFKQRDYKIFIVTNQSGIGRGLFTEEDFSVLSDWMISELNKKNIQITKIYHCPYHLEHGVGTYKKDSDMRKPKPGMILKAVAEYNIDTDSSILIGDKESDIEAGIAAKIGKTILYADAKQSKADYVVGNLKAVIDIFDTNEI